MSSAEDVLQVYDPGRHPGVFRFTGRVLGALALVLVLVFGALLLVPIGDGPEPALQYGPRAGPPTRLATTPTEEGVYVGYPTALYDPGRQAAYDEDALRAAVTQWREAHPDAFVLGTARVEAEDGTLLGYRLIVQDNPLVR